MSLESQGVGNVFSAVAVPSGFASDTAVHLAWNKVLLEQVGGCTGAAVCFLQGVPW